jgi:hypothetical protein
MKGQDIEPSTTNRYSGSFSCFIGVFQLDAILTGDGDRREFRSRRCQWHGFLAQFARTRETAKRRML